MNLSIDIKKKLLFHEEIHDEISEFFSITNEIYDEEFKNILKLYKALNEITYEGFNEKFFENIFQQIHKEFVCKEHVNNDFFILICSVLLNYLKNSKKETPFLLWNCYFYRSFSHLRKSDVSKSLDDLYISINLVENIDSLKNNYLMSLWNLALCYADMGLQLEAIDIYHNLSKTYRILKNDVYRTACLYNIAFYFNNVNKIKLLKKHLENTHIIDIGMEEYKICLLKLMEKAISQLTI